MYATRLSYIHLDVKHLESSVTFYSRFLDLQVSERFEKTSLLISFDNPNHFELALTEGEPTGSATLGFALPTRKDFEEALKFAQLEGEAFQQLDRGIADVIVLRDPDGNTVELFFDKRNESGNSFWRGETKAIV